MRDDNEQIQKALEDSPTRNDQDAGVDQSENSFNLQFREDNSPKQGIKNAWSCEDKTQELKVQASVKPLLEPTRSSKPSEIAPFPPVCYRINARPPPDCLYYFGYGVDMSQDRMSVYLRRNVTQRLWGILFGFKLRFNKRGNSREAGGFPNVELSCDDSVEGCVYTISQSELSLLDQSMGYPTHYTRIVLPTWILNSTEPTDHGVAQYCVPAVVYVAQDEWTMPGNWDMLDCSYNARQCARAGADILTSNYLQHLNALVERAR